MFGLEKFGVYRYSIEFAALATPIIERLPEGHAELVDQLRRAAISIARKAKELLEKVDAILSPVC